jgi:hypothetical protein
VERLVAHKKTPPSLSGVFARDQQELSEREDVDADEIDSRDDASIDMETGTDEVESHLPCSSLTSSSSLALRGGDIARRVVPPSPDITVVPTWVQFACALLASPCDPRRTLVGFDIDETLVQSRYEHPPLVPTDPRALPEFQWLRDYGRSGDSAEHRRLTDAFHRAYRSTLHEKILAEQMVPYVIQELRKRGFVLFGFTTRSFQHQRDVTLHSLTTLGVELGPNPFSKRYTRTPFFFPLTFSRISS